MQKPLVRFGANYSPQLMELLKEDPDMVDFLKLSREETVPEDVSAAPGRRFLLHWNLALGETADWDRWVPWLRRFEQPWINIHFMGETARPGAEISAELRALAEGARLRLGEETRLLVENVPYYGDRMQGRTHRLYADLGFLRTCAEEAGAALLLDTAHARVSADTLGMEIGEYLRAFEGGEVLEIHTTGPGLDPERGFLRDRHLELGEEDYEIVRAVLALHHPAALTLEYGGTGPKYEWRSDKAALRRQLVRLRAMTDFGAGLQA